MTLPILICALVYLMYRASTQTNKQFGIKFLQYELALKVMIYLMFLVHPSCCSTTFQVLRCRQFENGDSYLWMDYDIQCNSPKVLDLFQGQLRVTFQTVQFYAYLMVLVYPIMVPYAFYKVLEREKGELFDKKEDGTWEINIVKRNELGFLYASYERRTYYWETIELLKKM